MWSEEDSYNFYLEKKKPKENTIEYQHRKIIKKQEEELSNLESKYKSLKKELNVLKKKLNVLKKN